MSTTPNLAALKDLANEALSDAESLGHPLCGGLQRGAARESRAQLFAAIEALASSGQAASAVPEGVCKHGIRHPHACTACADEPSDAEIAAWMRSQGVARPAEENTNEDFLEDVYGQCCSAIKPYVDSGHLPGSVVESLQMLLERFGPALAASPTQPASAPAREGLSLAQESKYTVNGSAIVNRASGEAIPADEPVFIFRARDIHAREALEAYAAVLTPGEHRDAVVRRVADFAAFSYAHPERMKEPDTATPPAPLAPSIEPVGVLVAEIKQRARNATSLPRDPEPRALQLRELDKCVDELASLAAPASAGVEECPLPELATAVINAARDALNDSIDALDTINIPSHLAAALSLRLDEYDASLGLQARTEGEV